MDIGQKHTSPDERTYQQTHPMGDQPIVWTNEPYGRMIYIGIGHSPAVWTDKNFAILVQDAVLWASGARADRKDR